MKHQNIPSATSWWRDGSNFGAILPAPLAGRLRPWLYGVGIGMAAAGTAHVMHVEAAPLAHWLILAPVAVALWLCLRAMAWLEDRGAVSEAAQLPAAAPGAAEAATGATIRLYESEVSHV